MKLNPIISFISVLFLMLSLSVQAQELNLDVRLNTPQLQEVDPVVFQTLEKSIREFMNNTIWTEDGFQSMERIEGSIQINITEDRVSESGGGNIFKADIYVSASRPIYASNTYSPLLNHIDKSVSFTYEQFDPIYNSTEAFSDNLSSVLTYYAYIILGFDYDSFAPAGGEEFFSKAQNIINAVPLGSSEGWSATTSGPQRNRYWLIQNLLDPRVKPFRIAYYEYHRQCLDNMANEVQKPRAALLSALQSINIVNQKYPNSMVIKLFSDTKRREILEIFRGAGKGEKSKVYDIMASIDPAQQNEFKEFRGFGR